MEFCPRCLRPMTGQTCQYCGTSNDASNLPGQLPVGTVLEGSAGTYQLGLVLGQGGFGITYIAMDLRSGTRVAVKEYFPVQCGWASRGADGVTVTPRAGMDVAYNNGRISFLKEAQVLASMTDSHPAVVRGLDYVERNDTAYLVMEYLDGIPLYKVVREKGALSPQELLPKIDRLMDGIIWIHQRGIIHRDICPDNIMWMPDGTLKLVDFGAARVADGAGRLTVLYKPGFAPMEQRSSSAETAEQQSFYTDVYALGATIWYGLNGREPIDANDRLFAMNEVDPYGRTDIKRPDPLQPPAVLNPRQQAVLMKALSMAPHDRYQTMAEFQAALREASSRLPPPPPGAAAAGEGGGSGTTPPPQKRTSGGWLRSNKVLVAAVAALVVVVVSIILLLSGSSRSYSGQRSGGLAASNGQSSPGSQGGGEEQPQEPAVRSGTTEDGYSYEIVDETYAVLTGYSGEDPMYSMPDEIEGVPVTRIAANAFAGAAVDGMLLLPEKLEAIGANAFRGCLTMLAVEAYSDVTTDPTSFSGCDHLWWLMSSTGGVSGWKVPADTGIFYVGMDTCRGPVVKFEHGYNDDYPDAVSLVCETKDGSYVLLDIRPLEDGGIDLGWIELDGTVWIDSGALDHLEEGIAIGLAENMLIDFAAYDRFQWSAPEEGLADAWLFTCRLSNAINAARPAEAARVAPDYDMLRGASLMAGRLEEDLRNGDLGDTWGADFEELGITDWGGLLDGCYGQEDTRDELEAIATEYAVDRLGKPESDEDFPEFLGSYYTKLGAACVQGSDGDYYMGAYFVAPPADGS